MRPEPADLDLVGAAVSALRRGLGPELHPRAAAVRTASGRVVAGLGLGEGSEFRQPMAIAVIGGLITSTALSLVLVPVVYEFVDDIEHWLKPRFGRLVTRRDASDVPGHAPAE